MDQSYCCQNVVIRKNLKYALNTRNVLNPLTTQIKNFAVHGGCCTLLQFEHTGMGRCNVNSSSCPGRNNNKGEMYCCKHGCCRFKQYKSEVCVDNIQCPKSSDLSIQSLCCDHGCCNSHQYNNAF